MLIATNIVGLLFNVFVFASFIPKGVKSIRVLNLIGSIFGVIYGLMSGAFWVCILNVFTIALHLHHLWLIKKGKE